MDPTKAALDNQTRFTLTALGREEKLHPTHPLRPRCRQLLFVLDGQMELGQLRTYFKTFTDLEENLARLRDMGFITAHEISPQRAGERDDLVDKINTALQHASAPAGDRLENARRQAVDILISLTGANSPHVAKLKYAVDEQSLLAEVAACKRILGAVASASKAELFEQSVLKALKG